MNMLHVSIFVCFCRATQTVFRSWPVEDSSTASVSSSSRAMASSHSPTPSGTCSWRWRRQCTTTPSGSTSTTLPAQTPSSTRDRDPRQGRFPSRHPRALAPSAGRLPRLPAEAATTAVRFTKTMTVNCLLFSNKENRFLSQWRKATL